MQCGGESTLLNQWRMWLCSTPGQVEEMFLIVMLCVFFPSGLLFFLFFFTFFSMEKNPQHKIYHFWMFSTVKYIYVVVKRISRTFSSINLRLFPLQYQLSIPSSPNPLFLSFWIWQLNFFAFWLCLSVWEILAPLPGIEPTPSAVEAWSLFFLLNIYLFGCSGS